MPRRVRPCAEYTLILAEITVCGDSDVLASVALKQQTYRELISNLCTRGWTVLGQHLDGSVSPTAPAAPSSRSPPGRGVGCGWGTDPVPCPRARPRRCVGLFVTTRRRRIPCTSVGDPRPGVLLRALLFGLCVVS